MINIYVYQILIERALFFGQIRQARFAHGVSASQTDGMSGIDVEAVATHRTRQEVGPLWRLDRHRCSRSRFARYYGAPGHGTLAGE